MSWWIIRCSRRALGVSDPRSSCLIWWGIPQTTCHPRSCRSHAPALDCALSLGHSAARPDPVRSAHARPYPLRGWPCDYGTPKQSLISGSSAPSAPQLRSVSMYAGMQLPAALSRTRYGPARRLPRGLILAHHHRLCALRTCNSWCQLHH